jgi:hypothetical protein
MNYWAPANGTPNTQIWILSAMIVIKATSAQIGGYLKSSVDNAWWAGISAA